MGKHTFDELIKCGELTNAARFFAKEYYENGKMGHTRKLLIEHLADEVDKFNWVSVSERLPEDGETVLAYIKHNYADDGWRAYRVYEFKQPDRWVTMGNLCEVIAWMPLPAPPKEG